MNMEIMIYKGECTGREETEKKVGSRMVDTYVTRFEKSHLRCTIKNTVFRKKQIVIN